jgi:hypothetical protein
MPKTTPSEGTLFVQKGGRGNGNGTGRGNDAGKGKGKPFDTEHWKDKECFKCKNKGHPVSHCPNAVDDDDDDNDDDDDDDNDNDDDDDDDDKSRSSQEQASKGSRRISRASGKRSHSYNR